jgi:hypothetical protein
MTAGCGISITTAQGGIAVSVPETVVRAQSPTVTLLVQADPCGSGGSIFCRRALFSVAALAVAVSVQSPQVRAEAVSAPILVSANVGYVGPKGDKGDKGDPGSSTAVHEPVTYGVAMVRGQIAYISGGVAFPVTNSMPEAVLSLLAIIETNGAMSSVNDALLSGVFTDASLSLTAGRTYLGADSFAHGIDDASAFYVPIGHSGGGNSFFFNPRERYIRTP